MDQKYNDEAIKELSNQILELTTHLERDYRLITEAIGDIICIAKLNDYDKAIELIKSQFIVISNEDLKFD